jgi:hypothetical protein
VLHYQVASGCVLFLQQYQVWQNYGSGFHHICTANASVHVSAHTHSFDIHLLFPRDMLSKGMMTSWPSCSLDKPVIPPRPGLKESMNK